MNNVTTVNQSVFVDLSSVDISRETLAHMDGFKDNMPTARYKNQPRVRAARKVGAMLCRFYQIAR